MGNLIDQKQNTILLQVQYLNQNTSLEKDRGMLKSETEVVVNLWNKNEQSISLYVLA